MSFVEQVMENSHPHPPLDVHALAQCAQACADCVLSCTACADACLREDDVEVLRHCIRMNLDCADACSAAAGMLSRIWEPEAPVVALQLATSAAACDACARVCEQHLHHAHCRACAEACRRCEQLCRDAQRTFSAMAQATRQ